MTRASLRPFRPIPFTIIWRPWQRAAFQTHLTALVLLLATATLSLTPRIATSRKIFTRMWCSRGPRRRPVARGLVPFFNAAIQKTAMPVCTIILMRTYVFSVKAVMISQAVLMREDIWLEAIPKLESTRTRTCTSRRPLRPGISRSHRSRRYIYPELHRGRGPLTSRLADRWTITRARHWISMVVTKRRHHAVWVLTGVLGRGIREDSIAEASRIFLALRAWTWRLGKWVHLNHFF